MRTYQARLDVADEAPLQADATVFGRALRSLHAARRSDKTVAKPQFMRAFELTSRQYNAVKFSLDGMESSIVALRPGRIAELQARIKAIDVKLAQLCNPKSTEPKPLAGRTSAPTTFETTRAVAAQTASALAFKTHNVMRRRADLAQRLALLEAEGHPRICFGSRKLFNAQHHLAKNAFRSPDDWRAAWRAQRDSQFLVIGSKDESGGCQGCVMTHLGGHRFSLKLRLDGPAKRHLISRPPSPMGSIICSGRCVPAKQCHTDFCGTTRAGAFLFRRPRCRRRLCPICAWE